MCNQNYWGNNSCWIIIAVVILFLFCGNGCGIGCGSNCGNGCGNNCGSCC